MRCSCYATEPPALVAALVAADILARYQARLADELPALADRALALHLRRMSAAAAEAAADGFERLAERDRATADALLSDLLAVATWERWPLPLAELGERDLPVEELPRGLLGADRAQGGAGVWLLDDETVAIARARIADDAAVLPES